MLSTTESHLEEIFSGIAPVERVKKIRDYAFIHFSEREGALKSIELMNGNDYIHTHTILYRVTCTVYIYKNTIRVSNCHSALLHIPFNFLRKQLTYM